MQVNLSSKRLKPLTVVTIVRIRSVSLLTIVMIPKFSCHQKTGYRKCINSQECNFDT